MIPTSENLNLRPADVRGGQDRSSRNCVRSGQLSSLGAAVVGSRRDVVHTQADVARQQLSIDHLKERIYRIERRLDLRDGAG